MHEPTSAIDWNSAGSNAARFAPFKAGGLARPVRCAASGVKKGPVVVIDNYDSFTYNLCQVTRRTAGKISWQPNSGRRKTARDAAIPV